MSNVIPIDKQTAELQKIAEILGELPQERLEEMREAYRAYRKAQITTGGSNDEN